MFVILISALFSCDDQMESQEISIIDFTIDIPANWTLEEVQGYDSYVKKIVIDEKEVIDLELGWYSTNLIVDNSSHEIIYKLIDNREAKIAKPKNFQKGITGVYFDNRDSQKAKLLMSSTDLTRAHQWLFLQAIETIKFN